MRRLLLGALLLSTIAAALPGLVRDARTAASLHGLPYHVRRERTMGAFYPSIMEVLRATSPGQPLALITRPGRSIDDALFFDYYAYPRHTRIYSDPAFYGVDPKGPATVVAIDEKASLSSYVALRFEEMQRRGRIVHGPTLHLVGPHFVVPMALSIDGVLPAAYTTEATIVADHPAEVTLTLRPSGIVKRLTIQREIAFIDLVYEVFGRRERGWLEVDSNEALRAAFWLVNRGTGAANELALVTSRPPNPLHVPSGNQLWLVNLAPVAAGLRINGKVAFLLPYEAPPRSYTCPCEVLVVNEGASVYAFAAEKMPNGGTRFSWPEGQQ
jgi:hypothetical protein